MTVWLRVLLVSCLLPVLALPAAGEGAVVPPESQERFERDVRPILSRNCLACHDGETRQSGLALESVADVLEGGALSGPAVLAGQSGASPLIQYLKGEKQPRMPLIGSPLPEADVAAISQWIDELPAAAAGGAGEPSLAWPWTPLAEPALPEVRHKSWVRNGVDAFILAGAGGEGNGSGAARLPPGPPAASLFRFDRPAAHSGGGRALSGGPLLRSLWPGDREPALPSRLRRPLGTALARPGALRRHRGRVDRRCPLPPVAIPRPT